MSQAAHRQVPDVRTLVSLQCQDIGKSRRCAVLGKSPIFLAINLPLPAVSKKLY